MLTIPPMCIRARTSVRLLALLLALAAAWPTISSVRAAALHIPAGLTAEQDDHNAILQWDFDTKNPVAPLPIGVAPSGAYCASLDEQGRSALRDAYRRRLGAGDEPFELTARAWAVVGTVSAG